MLPTDARDQVLVEGLLLWKGEKSTDAPWKFAGIASDESADLEGDSLLKSMLDVSYAADRGYVNWHHSRSPEDQIGYLTKAVVLDAKNVKELRQELGLPKLEDSASIYVEGELYQHVKKAAEVRQVMMSAPPGRGLGLSIDGVIARNAKTMEAVKAFVRGVAVTPIPAHPKTLVLLKKSLQELSRGSRQLSMDEAILFVGKMRPYWSFDLASRFVKHAMSQSGKGE